MSYKVKEIFYTLQGEGINTGRVCVLCRFAGCNLWSGSLEQRKFAKCYFCDTDFVGLDGENGGEYETSADLVSKILEVWREGGRSDEVEGNKDSGHLDAHPWVLLSGGEPLLQVDDELVSTLKASGCFIALETNGTLKVPDGIDWITVSPKPDTRIMQNKGNELKLVYPQSVTPMQVEHLEFEYFLLSPMFTPSQEVNIENARRAVEYCKLNPKWRLTVQLHKLIGFP